MKIELISEEPLNLEELEYLRNYRGIFCRRRILLFGASGILSAPFLSTFPVPQARAQVSLVARYMFYAFRVSNLVAVSAEARAWCSLYNDGQQRQRQTLNSEIKGSAGIEDEGSINVSMPPSAKQTYVVTGNPDSTGEKTYTCTTDDDQRAARFRVVES
jgi:hypothetical protein